MLAPERWEPSLQCFTLLAYKTVFVSEVLSVETYENPPFPMLGKRSCCASPCCLNAHWFLSLADARKKLDDWRKYYNEKRPHGAIGQRAPITLLNHDGVASPPS